MASVLMVREAATAYQLQPEVALVDLIYALELSLRDFGARYRMEEV